LKRSKRVADRGIKITLPIELGFLTNLQYLILDGNKPSGPLPTEILQLTNLTQLEPSGNLFSEAELDNTMVALGVIFSCNKTTVEMVLTTNCWSAETSWEVATEVVAFVASGGGYILETYPQDEKMCIFTLFDQCQDGGPTGELTRLEKVYQIDRPFMILIHRAMRSM